MRNLTILLIAFCCSSCSTSYITPKYVFPQRYESLSCEELVEEQYQLKSKLAKLSIANVQENDDSISDVDYTVGNQISEKLGEYNAISQVIKDKNCKL